MFNERFKLKASTKKRYMAPTLFIQFREMKITKKKNECEKIDYDVYITELLSVNIYILYTFAAYHWFDLGGT